VNASKHVNSTARILRIVREESLRQRLRARDEQALVELIDQALPWMLGVAEGILHDVAEAEEVAMDAFRKLWDRIETVADNGSGLMPWLLRATRNRAIDRLRARARRIDGAAAAAVDLDEIPGVDAAPVDEAGMPGWPVHGAVHRALYDLPEDQRIAVRLAFFAGLTHSEIAESLGIPVGTVKSRLRIAFDKLRVSLAPIRDWIL